MGFELAGAAAVVTGASRGLGRAVAVGLARAGARVALVARDGRALDRVADEVRAAGGEAHALAADVGDPDAAARVLGAASALVGPPDVLVHAAATLGPVPMPLLGDLRPEDLSRALEVNLLGPFRLTRAALGGMLLRRRGAVLLVSSDAAVEAYPGWGAYAVSKAALEHLGRVWAKEVEGTGVRVLTVDPGEMDTDMHRAATSSSPAAASAAACPTGLPDADPATLARPEAVAETLLDLLAWAPNGGRLVASAWER